jgi:eukaryotic-like serine/threonine-protein kinase
VIGQRLGPYEVLDKLGEGGMGEVYRARDTKLDRDVAIKILPDAFAADPDRLMRFEREAKTLAALNHPNIAHVYGVEESGSTRALVMELVDGEDLASRIARPSTWAQGVPSSVGGRGAVPLDEALSIARQVVEALEAAHEAGIIHRDLKPANIQVRRDGTVKVLDFGLAKPQAPGPGAQASGRVVESPTITSPALTMQGVILGTAAYMAPEQAKGRPVDKRVDNWAFGCVLYEMLSGSRPFAGDDLSETLAFVLTREVDWTALPASTPPTVRLLLRSCLEKNPKHRLRDIGDARLLLDQANTADVPRRSPPRIAAWRQALPWAIAAVATIAAVAAAFAAAWTSRVPERSAPVTRFALQTAGPGAISAPAVSPDGSFVAYSTDRIYYRRFSELEPRALGGTEGARNVFVAPDARWIGFYAEGKLKKVPLAGGDPQIITDVDGDTPGAAWSPDGRVYYSSGWNGSPLLSVAADGGAVKTVSTLDIAAGERGHWWPDPLPDGRHVLFTIWYAGAGVSEARVGVLDVQTGQHWALFPGAMPRYADGSLVYYAAGVYQLVRFDATSLTTTGEPVPILPDALGLAPQGTSVKPVSLAANGTVAYLADELYPERRIAWIDRQGQETPTGLSLRVDGDASLSRDGTRLALARPQSGVSHIWVYDVSGSGEQRLTFPGSSTSPYWHPDGQRVAFTSMRRGDFDIVVKSVDDLEAPIDLDDPVDESPHDWTPDGRHIIAKSWASDGATEIFLIDPVRRERTTLLAGAFEKGTVRLSRDGRWLAACANPAGAWNVYVRAFPGPAALQQVAPSSRECGMGSIRWSRVKNELFLSPDGERLSVIEFEERAGRLAVLSDRVIARLPRRTALYDVSPDGQRLLVGIPTSTDRADGEIRVIVNGLQALHTAPR